MINEQLTWNVAAEKRPRHMNWLTLTPTLNAHDSSSTPSAGMVMT
jgi:hypothetical protein